MRGAICVAVAASLGSTMGAHVGRAATAVVSQLAGDYICRAGCRVTDAPPNIEIEGAVARCRSELGGIFTGRVLTDRSVACFNMEGALSADGTRIIWSNGSIWERR